MCVCANPISINIDHCALLWISLNAGSYCPYFNDGLVSHLFIVDGVHQFHGNVFVEFSHAKWLLIGKENNERGEEAVTL